MRPECIGRLIARFKFPAGETKPSAELYSTWPEQARLLCSGKTEALRALQQKLLSDLGSSENLTDAAVLSAGSRSRSTGFTTYRDRCLWIQAILALMFLVAALAAWLVASRLSHCQCIASGAETHLPDITSVDLSTDQIFDYNMSEFRSSAHREKVLSDLRGLFKGFDGISIESVDAYTDPIGSTEYNRNLGQLRASTIRTLIREIIKSSEGTTKFARDLPPSEQTSSGPSQEDAAFWQYCFSKYYLDQPREHRPLVELRDANNPDDRVPCDLADVNDIYPACAPLSVPPANQRPSAGYAQRAENLRELTACLAPMRHVIIRFSYQRQLSNSE